MTDKREPLSIEEIRLIMDIASASCTPRGAHFNVAYFVKKLEQFGFRIFREGREDD